MAASARSRCRKNVGFDVEDVQTRPNSISGPRRCTRRFGVVAADLCHGVALNLNHRDVNHRDAATRENLVKSRTIPQLARSSCRPSESGAKPETRAICPICDGEFKYCAILKLCINSHKMLSLENILQCYRYNHTMIVD